MRKSLVAIVASLFLILTAVPALALQHATFCQNYNNGKTGAQHQEIRVCASINIHTSLWWKEAKVDIDVIDLGPDFIAVERDYLRLWKGSNIVKTNNWDSQICFDDTEDFGCIEGSWGSTTDWFTHCGPANATYLSSFRFQIFWGTGGSFTWRTIFSDPWTECA